MDFDAEFSDMVNKLEADKTLHSTISLVSPDTNSACSDEAPYHEQSSTSSVNQSDTMENNTNDGMTVYEDNEMWFGSSGTFINNLKNEQPVQLSESTCILEYKNLMSSIGKRSLDLSIINGTTNKDYLYQTRDSPCTPVNNASPHYDRTSRLVRQPFRRI